MSMRYADISGPTNASVPAMPTVPMGLRPGVGVGGTVREEMESDGGAGGSKKERERYEDSRIADTSRKMLDMEDFDPDACELARHR